MADMNAEDYLVARFNEFVACAHRNVDSTAVRVPYQWQCRLMLEVARNGHWPDRIVAPTAAGKTCVIDVHVFLNAMAGLQQWSESDAELSDGNGNAYANVLSDVPLRRIPRRLVLTVSRRSLVDDQYEEAAALEHVIVNGGEEPDNAYTASLKEFRSGLEYRAGNVSSENKPLRVVELRGGLAASPENREWRYYPQTCAVICATPDMFGSRLLFRGYGTSAAMRPLEAGLLAYDTVLVADEAHLSRQLVLTAQQVHHLESMAEDDSIRASVAPLQVVETTATPVARGDADVGFSAIGVEETDFAIDESLRKRLCTPKWVSVDCSATSEGQIRQSIVERCAALIQENMEHGEDRDACIVGCILNTVTAAEKVSAAISKRIKTVTKRPVRTFVGPMRPYEKQRIAEQLRGIFADTESDNIPCCIVGTQTLEVGVDADFADLVTELAPGTSLVQRAGRVNRRGLRPEAHVYVYGLADGASNADWKKVCGPYSKESCSETIDWLNTLPNGGDSDNDLSAWSVVRGVLQGNPVPGEQARRLLYQRLEPWDVENLSHTDESLCGDVNIDELHQSPSDLNLWLRDSLDGDDTPEIGIVARLLPRDSAVAASMLELAPPVDGEVFPVRTWEQINGKKNSLRAYLQSDDGILTPLGSVFPQDDERHECRPRRAFLYRISNPEGQRVTVLGPHSSNRSIETLQPGDVVVVDTYAELFSDTCGAAMYSPDKGGRAADVYNDCSSDVDVIRVDMLAENRESRIADELLANWEALREQRDSEAEESLRRSEELERAVTHAAGCLAMKEPLPDDWPADAESNVLVDLFSDMGERDIRTKKTSSREYERYYDLWVVVRTKESILGDDASQEISSERTVLLDGAEGHQQHVAERAKELSERIGLDPMLVESLFVAGMHHDDGKRDERFQRLLRRGRARGNGPYWAKSVFSSWRAERSFRERNQLRGWRHEQRSVAEYMALADRNEHASDKRPVDTGLVERLIGTSHGHGRSTFAHGAGFLIPRAAGECSERVKTCAQYLFDEGGWESLVDRTSQRYGYWGVSYLEAILRAADITSSKEGR
ncbi:type I-U CRISPR-associated helicase/endonuclease Cas3 [Bifidobacterium phasiani]|uniref:Type I-U CRISPR-associated helicase/endonuclease Cas3 n=1 Tax=Bifidobacterium phasiani TaxID=2834431 RepID=A0ABS6W9C9_9BIFI|nr:type I-U CRISPR-associated helicase/endonuclease Cas3 [Bifidobacterium phasiani]MBW3083109.1 type I-U CRISPR-associated helicase/endonuclease Cas3 [Bifidobacterium phasiani]